MKYEGFRLLLAYFAASPWHIAFGPLPWTAGCLHMALEMSRAKRTITKTNLQSMSRAPPNRQKSRCSIFVLYLLLLILSRNNTKSRLTNQITQRKKLIFLVYSQLYFPFLFLWSSSPSLISLQRTQTPNNLVVVFKTPFS